MEDSYIPLVKNYIISHPTISLFSLSQSLQIPHINLENLILKVLAELGTQNYRIIYTIYSNKVSIICSDLNVTQYESMMGVKPKIYALQRITEELENLFSSEAIERKKIISHMNGSGGLFFNEFSVIPYLKQNIRELHAQHKLQFKPVPKPKVPEIEVKKEVEEVVMEEFEENITVGVKNEPKKVTFSKIRDMMEIDDLDDIMMQDTIETDTIEEILPVKRCNLGENDEHGHKIKKEEVVEIDKESQVEEKEPEKEQERVYAVKKSAAKASYLNSVPDIRAISKSSGKMKQIGLACFYSKG
ncbi:unnamed protein product [Blepharisma stoltei]|uniref:DNA polymerase delta subunit 3 n=1 Tax=Blepharisma stoltei TaxID=1481888 RepID=A0AAU9KDB4_9CILI|nr:unnamed protein product [Blepharisma stoltei]